MVVREDESEGLLLGFGVRSSYARNSTVGTRLPRADPVARVPSRVRSERRVRRRGCPQRAQAGGPRSAPERIVRLEPGGDHSQAELLELLGLAGDEFAESIFARSGVTTRRLSVSRESLGRSLQARAAATEEEIFDMAVAALGGLDFDPADVGVLVTAGYWSLGGPTLGHRLIEQLGLGPWTDKYHVTGAGCASAVPLLRLAGQVLRDRPDERALVVAAEAVSGFMTRAAPGDERTKVVGSALFGDGCGAALLDLGAPEVRRPARSSPAPSTSCPARSTRSASWWARSDSYMQLGRELPLITETQLPGLVEDFLLANGLDTTDVDHWLLHPGGRGILEGAQRGSRAVGRGRRAERGGAVRVRERGNGLELLRAEGGRGDARPGSGRARPLDLGRPWRDRRIDVVELVEEECDEGDRGRLRPDGDDVAQGRRWSSSASAPRST